MQQPVTARHHLDGYLAADQRHGACELLTSVTLLDLLILGSPDHGKAGRAR